MTAAIAGVVDLTSTEIVDNATITAEQEADFNQGIDIVGNVLLGFAIVSLFVSIFIIYNTFAIVLGQRIREIGLLRRPPRFITNVFYQRIVVPPVVVRNLERHLLSSHWSRSWQPVRRRTSRGASLLNTNTGGQTRASDSGTCSAPNKQGK